MLYLVRYGEDDRKWAVQAESGVKAQKALIEHLLSGGACGLQMHLAEAEPLSFSAGGVAELGFLVG